MKLFDELTDAEILALTDDQINYYIDRTCAEQGVALVPPTPPAPPTKPPVENDVNVYNVAGILVTDIAEAQRLRECVALLKSRGENKYGYPHYRSYFALVTEPVDITPVAMLSEASALAMKDEIAAFEEEKKAYETAKREYDDAVRGRDRVGEHIRATVRCVRSEDFERQSVLAEFERYAFLADGDRRMAWRFLSRVKGNAARLLPDLDSELGGPDVIGPTPEPVAVAEDDIPY